MRTMSRLQPLILSTLIAAALSGCDAGTSGSIEGIATVQGSAERSAHEGKPARIEGVVTLLMADGAFVQSLQPDADPATAEGLFVMPAADQQPLMVGQHIQADGLVGESGDGAMLTTLTAARITVLGDGALPEPIVLSAPPANWEALEGMRVRLDTPMTVVGNDALSRFGEVDLAFGGRVFTPTEQALPGDAARAKLAENRARTVVLDDASSRQNPRAIAWWPSSMAAEDSLRAGSTLSGIEAVVDQRFGAYRLQAAAPIASAELAPRPEAPKVEGALRIAGMNLLNLFNGDGQGGGFPTTRGAQNAEAYQRQLQKHVAVITALDPSVIAAQELENDGFDAESAIRQLAKALNDAQPGAAWRPVVSDGRPGTDQITVGILYRADRVDTVGAPAMKLDGPFEYGSRPLLAQSFRMDGGPAFTVVSIHFKSKGGCDNAEGADRDQGDGQACFNAKRLESALALADWIATDPTGSGSDRVALIGDFNAYGMEDPMRALRERGWLDPLGAEGSYSFVFDGQSGRLDHALLSASFAADLAGAAKWHSNADEPLTFAYDGRLGRDGEVTPWRSSDHDPLLLGFRVESAR